MRSVPRITKRLGLRGPVASYVGVVEEFVRNAGEGVSLTLRVPSGAKKSSVEGSYGRHALKIKVAAPPVDGKANAETERFRARLLGLSRTETSVVRGISSRDKVVLLKGVESREAVRTLKSLIG